MKENLIQDERIVLAKREIQSNGFQLVKVVLLISVIIQQFFMQAPFSQFAVEFFLWIGCELYSLLYSYRKGLSVSVSHEKSNKRFLIVNLVCGILAVPLYVILSGEDNINYLVILFVCIFAFNYLFHIIAEYTDRKKQKSIDDKMNEDEMKA